MQINYILLVHKNPEQVKSLVQKLDSSNSKFFIHVDKTVDATAFKNVLGDYPNSIFLSDASRKEGTWGDLGIVIATINALKLIRQEKRSGYCVLMSGQDYPLKNNTFIHNYFQNNYGTNFIELNSMLERNGWGLDGGLNRVKQYKINFSNKRNDFIQLPTIYLRDFYKTDTLKKIYRLLHNRMPKEIIKCFRKRSLPISCAPYGGSQWWALPIETVKKILDFIDNTPEFLFFHKDTLLPDEIFFHSILNNISESDNHFKIKPSLTYVNWSRKNVPLPVTFTLKDKKELLLASKTHLFARKFDCNIKYWYH